MTGWLSACNSAGETLLDGSDVSEITDGRLVVGAAIDVDELDCESETTWREDELPAIAIDSGGLWSLSPRVEWLGPAIAISVFAPWPPVSTVAGMTGAWSGRLAKV